MEKPVLNETQINAFKRFWKSENGQALRKHIDFFREDWLDASMRMQKVEDIQYFVARAAGVATIVQDLDALCDIKKEKETEGQEE